MSWIHVNSKLLISLLLFVQVPSFAQNDSNGDQPDEDRLISVLKSDASRKEKADACLLLARVGTRECVPVLVALLGDEDLSHMARYALEPIPDRLVDESLRNALERLKGRPLVGVIGSIGVRRDAGAVGALAGLLADDEPDVARAAARSLGSIGNSSAAKALHARLDQAPAEQQLAICEGLFRCAETLAAKSQRAQAMEIYDMLRSMDNSSHQIQAGAVRGAILARGNEGLAVLKQYLLNPDYGLFAAACRTSLEMPGADVTAALKSVLREIPAEKQILVIQTLGMRADPAAVPALSDAAKNGAQTVRLAAIRALAEVGHESAASVLEKLTTDPDPDLSQAAKTSLSSVQDTQRQPGT
jgi:HEAT repeat protein